MSPWQGTLVCNIDSNRHCLSHVHHFSGVILDWLQWTWVLTSLWYPLGINGCYRAVLCFGLLLISASINLRQSCWFCPFFLVCLKCMSVFSNRLMGKEMLCAICCRLVAILPLWGCSIFCWQVVLSCGFRLQASWAWAQAFWTWPKHRITQFYCWEQCSGNSVKGMVFFIISTGYSFTPCPAVSSGAFTHICFRSYCVHNTLNIFFLLQISSTLAASSLILSAHWVIKQFICLSP